MGQYFNVYFENKVEAVPSYAVIDLSHYCYNCNSRSTNQPPFLLKGSAAIALVRREWRASKDQGQPTTKL